MRTLTVTRSKRFVGIAMPVAIYIEDAASNDHNTITVDEKSCRFLGFVKSGGSLTVSIPDGEQKIYAVTPRSMQKSNISEPYVVPAGTEDVMLSGSVYFLSSVFKAVTFVFDGNITEEEKKQYKKRESRAQLSYTLTVSLISMAILFVALFFTLYQTDKTFTSEAGISITLTTKFKAQEVEGFDFLYSSQKVAVFGSKDSFELFPEIADYTNEEYGLLVLETGEFDPTVTLKPFGDSYSISYQAENFYYFCVIYKTDDAFWFVQFGTDIDDADDYADDFQKWANSVTFS